LDLTTPPGPRPQPEGAPVHKNAKSEQVHLDLLKSRDVDEGENKYRKKSLLELIMRWAKNQSRRRIGKVQKRMMSFLVFLLVFLTFLSLMSYLSGRKSWNDDPMLEPMNNPYVKVAY